MKCKYCGEEFETNIRGKRKDYCNKADCIRQAKNEAQRKWYANRMQVLKGTKARIIEQKDKKKIVYSSTDRAINELNNGTFQEVRECARELGAIRFKIMELIKKLSHEQSLYDKYDQDFLHKIENFAQEDELKEDEVLNVVREHINRRNNRRVVKDKEDILKHLIQGLISNPEQYVVQSIKDRGNRIYKPRVKEEVLGTKEVVEVKSQD